MKKNSLESFFLRNWYGNSRWTFLLLPLHWIFVSLSELRRLYLIKCKQCTPTIPTIIVGNISVGGTGKTPLIIALVKKLQAEGFSPGIISRGYGSQAMQYPYIVSQDSTAVEAGDEPLTIFQHTQCPVVIGPHRFESISAARDYPIDVILSDDGLQDYRLGRHLEIAVVDGQRWFGNGWRLPVGPLREPVSRLSSCDMVVANNPAADPLLENFYPMQIKPCYWINLKSGEKRELDELNRQQQFHAVAGIGNPQRFYQTLSQLGLTVVEHDFPDHHSYTEDDFPFAENTIVVMTEKDAVKCKNFSKPNWYYLVVESELDQVFWRDFLEKVNAIQVQKADLSKLL